MGAILGCISTVSANPAKTSRVIIPARFERDLSKSSEEIAYVGRSPAYALSVRSGGKVSYALRNGTTVSVVRMELAGAAADVVPVAEERLSATTHLYTGSAGTPAHSQTGNWARVRVPEVYAGVDLAYDARQSSFELSFSVAPRANPERIRLRFRGERRIRIDAAGDLVLETQAGMLRFRRPLAYQPDAAGSKPVSASFRLREGVLSFRVGPYNRLKPLIIDPVVSFSSFLGGSGFDSVNAVAADSSGASYVTGETDSMVFPSMGGSGVRPSRDAFVCKLSNDSAHLLYTTILSGSGRDAGQAIAVDSSGSAVVAGLTSGGFPVTAGALQTVYGGLQDAFVARLNPNGQLVYATYLGGPAADVATGVALDQSGNTYVTGYTASLRFPTTAGVPQTTYAGGAYDAFVSKLNASGALVYSTLLGGSGNDTASSIAVTSGGGACIAGQTNSKNLPLVNPVQTTVGGGGNAFVGCLNSTGSAWQYLTYLGGVCCMSADGANSVAVDGSGAVYIAGSASNLDFPTTANAFQQFNQGTYDAFVAKLSSSGSLVYSTLIGGSGSDSAASIAVDSTGRAWVAGDTNSFDFPTAGSWVTSPGGGAFDGFVSVLSADGSKLLNSGYLAGSADDRAFGIALTGTNSAAIVGMTDSPDFPTTPGVLQPSAPASYNGFLTQVSFVTVTNPPTVAAESPPPEPPGLRSQLP